MTRNIFYDELFRNFDKAAAFDQLAEMFFNCNFGTVPKSEIELLMFNFYMNALIQKHQNADGVIDYNQCSDYEIAKQLGLTQSKVRNLKIKKQARYRVDFDWQKSLESVKDYIRLDDDRHIVIPVIDPNLNEEIRNFVNRNGGYVEFESGRDHIKLRIEYYLMLMYETLDVTDKKAFVKETRKSLNQANDNENCFVTINKADLCKDVVSMIGSGLNVVDNVIQIVNPQNTLINVLHSLIMRALN